MGDTEQGFETLLETMRKAAGVLRDAEIPFMLSGGLAAWARGGPPSMKDLDFAIHPEDADRALEALADAGMRTERPPQGWLVKAWDDEVMVDLIFEPTGHPNVAELFERGEELNVMAMSMRVMALEDVLVTKLLSLNEHSLDYASSLAIARALREQIDWEEVRARTAESPYARAFFALLEGLDILGAPAATAPRHARVRVVPPQE